MSYLEAPFLRRISISDPHRFFVCIRFIFGRRNPSPLDVFVLQEGRILHISSSGTYEAWRASKINKPVSSCQEMTSPETYQQKHLFIWLVLLINPSENINQKWEAYPNRGEN